MSTNYILNVSAVVGKRFVLRSRRELLAWLGDYQILK
jgi:hypothetical protein